MGARRRRADLMEAACIVTRTHDAGLALLKDGVPTLVLEERFNREKHTRRFPFFSLHAAFDDRGLNLGDIDVVTMGHEVAQTNHVLGRGPKSPLRPQFNSPERSPYPVYLDRDVT
jgi:predicted NodU family carbamoyl transferase